MDQTPPCDLLARLTGRSVLLLDVDGRVLQAGGANGLRLPEFVGKEPDLRRMARSTIATPATWEIDGREWRVFGMRWPAAEPRILCRLVPKGAEAIHAVTDRLAALEERQIEVRAALSRAMVAEAQMARSSEQLRQTNRELEDYAALVAHDLRAPIRTAKLLANRALHAALEDDDPEMAADLGERLHDTLSRVDSFVLKLLDYASLRDHGLSLQHHDAGELIEEAILDLASSIDDAAADVQVHATGTLYGDKELLAAVIRELVLNAVKYRHPDRPPVVTITHAIDAHTSALVVADNGVGIPPAERDRALAMFQRLHHSPSADGVGFGLSYCRRIVELHEGTIELDCSSLGIGTEVRIELPAGLDLRAEHDQADRQQREGSGLPTQACPTLQDNGDLAPLEGGRVAATPQRVAV